MRSVIYIALRLVLFVFGLGFIPSGFAVFIIAIAEDALPVWRRLLAFGLGLLIISAGTVAVASAVTLRRHTIWPRAYAASFCAVLFLFSAVIFFYPGGAPDADEGIIFGPALGIIALSGLVGSVIVLYDPRLSETYYD